MDAGNLAEWAALGAVGVGGLIGYGRLNQRVDDHERRLGILEEIAKAISDIVGEIKVMRVEAKGEAKATRHSIDNLKMSLQFVEMVIFERFQVRGAARSKADDDCDD